MKGFPWEQLQERLDYLKKILREHRIKPEKGYGLQYMIEETEAILRQEKKDVRGVDLLGETIKSIKGLQSLWTLTESLKILDKKGINYHSQLMNCRAGKIEYGEREQKQKDIYYKDFELEIFIAAQLADKTDLKVKLPQDQGPFDIMVESDLAIQVKHPSNIENAFDRLGKFQRDLTQSQFKGVLAVGHEDAFDCASRIQFSDESDFREYFRVIADRAEVFGRSIISRFEKSENVVGLIGMTTLYVLIGSDSSAAMNLRRFSNSSVIENRVAGEKYTEIVEALSVFNPKPRHIKFENGKVFTYV